MANKDPRDGVLVIPIIGELTWELADNLFTSTWEYLKISPETEKLVVVISSDGGDRDAGWSVYQILRSFNRDIVSVALNNVYSSAIYPFIAGERRYVFADAMFLFHPTVIANDKDEERPLTNYEEDLESDRHSNSRLVQILKGVDVPQRIIRRMVNKTKHFYLNAEKAIEYKFANKIITSIDKPWEL